MAMGIEFHKERYAIAWKLHQDKNTSEYSKRIMEHVMDSAQNHFSWDEFQEFKKTLPDYAEHWFGMYEKATAKAAELKESKTCDEK